MKFDNVYEYVKSYFQRNFLESYLIFEGRMEYIEKQYISFYEKNILNKYSYSELEKGNIDNELNKLLRNFVFEYFTEGQQKDISVLYNYVEDLLVKRGVNINFSNDIFDHIAKVVSSRVWSQYDSSRLGKEDFDHVINLVYNNVCNQYARMISVKIDKILDNRYDYFELRKLGLDKEDLKKYVISSIFMNENRNFLVRLRSLIVSPDKSFSQIGIELNKYINQYFSRYSDKYSVVDDLKKTEDKKNNSHVQKSVKNENNVQNKNGEVVFNINMMKNNSIQRDGFPKKIKLNKQQVKIAKTVALLALLGTLVGVGLAINYVNKETDDTFAIMRAESLSVFDFSKIVRNDAYYDELSDEVLKIYSKLDQLDDENYKNIGLYYAYDGSLDVNKDAVLGDMEKFFDFLKKKMVNEDINFGLRNNIHADMKEEYFYLDFVYDTLIDAGYKELNSDEYQKVLLRYKYANFGTRFGVVGVQLKKGEEILIDNVMSMYKEYYEQVKLNVGYLMVDGRYTFYDTYSKSSGKGM